MAFVPRLKADGIYNNPLWYSSAKNPYYPSFQLPNCTCYAWGRVQEILGYIPDGFCGYPPPKTGNGQDWVGMCDPNKINITMTPSLGAVGCWGNTRSSKGGHVAVVEEILPSGDIRVSQSGYTRPIAPNPPDTFWYFEPEIYYRSHGYKPLSNGGQASTGWMDSPDRGYTLWGFMHIANIPMSYQWMYDVNNTGYLPTGLIDNNAIIIYSVLTLDGWTLNAICGLLGCARAESGFNPGAVEIGWPIPNQASGVGTAGLGICQWTQSTRSLSDPQPLLWNANRLGVDWWDGDFQIEMIKHGDDPLWINCGQGGQQTGWNTFTPYPEKLSFSDYKVTTRTPEQCVENWYYQFEMPNPYPGDQSNIRLRQEYARYWYEFLQGMPIIPPFNPGNPKYGSNKIWLKPKKLIHKRKRIIY